MAETKKLQVLTAGTTGLPWTTGIAVTQRCSRCSKKNKVMYRRCDRCRTWAMCTDCFNLKGFNHSCIGGNASGPWPSHAQEAAILDHFDAGIPERDPTKAEKPSHSGAWVWTSPAALQVQFPHIRLQGTNIRTDAPVPQTALASTSTAAQDNASVTHGPTSADASHTGSTASPINTTKPAREPSKAADTTEEETSRDGLEEARDLKRRKVSGADSRMVVTDQVQDRAAIGEDTSGDDHRVMEFSIRSADTLSFMLRQDAQLERVDTSEESTISATGTMIARAGDEFRIFSVSQDPITGQTTRATIATIRAFEAQSADARK